MGMEDRYRPSAGVTSRVTAGEAAVKDGESNVSYRLAGAGAMAWAMIERGHTPAEAAAAVAEHFGILPHRAETDVGRLLCSLREAALLEKADPDAVPEPVPDQAPPPRGTRYSTPKLERAENGVRASAA